MTYRSWAWRGLLVCACLCAIGSPTAAHSQTDSLKVARGTLLGWDEQLRLIIFDRGGAYFGRSSSVGILQRFNRLQDAEYTLDQVSYAFTLVEEYEWYQRGQGVRYKGASINKVQLAQHVQFAASIPLSSTWSVPINIDLQQDLEAKRSVFRAGFRKSFMSGRISAFLTGWVKTQKPESDIEVGAILAPGASQLTLAVAALDLFSDPIYQGIGVPPSIADTAFNYTSNPFTLRAALNIPIGRQWRVEAYALAMTPASVTVERQTAPEEGFSQDERYAYTGGLVEWEPTRATAIAGFATWVQARLGREALSLGLPEDDFDLTERTSQLGAYGIHNFKKFSAEVWLAHIWRVEDRVRPDTSVAPNVNYEDRTWAGRSNLVYQATGGFRGAIGVDFTAREIIGEDRMPSNTDLNATNVRLRMDLGWSFGKTAFIFFGFNAELDGDVTSSPAFDGGHARAAFYF